MRRAGSHTHATVTIVAVTRRTPDRPATPALIALIMWTVFVLLRLWRVGDGDIGAFALAGTDWTDASSGLPLVDGPGYDGQFFHRLGTAPLDPADRVAGTVLDSVSRAGRIGYPLLVRSTGVLGVPPEWGLVLVNLVAVTVLGFLGGTIARSAGRHALWGVIVPIYFGFAFSIARDLAEVVAAAALLGGVWAAHRQRPVVAAAALSLAVLTRESTIAVVAALGLAELVRVVSRRRPVAPSDAVWVVPGVAFAAWQSVVLVRWGTLPILAGGAGSLRGPGAALLEQAPTLADPSWLGADPLNAVKVVESVVLVVLVTVALVSSRRLPGGSPIRPALIGAAVALVTVDVPIGVWTDRNDLRMFSDVYVLAATVLLVAGRRAPLLSTVAVAGCSGAAALSFLVGL
jgi:hypothetical protein